MAYTTQIIETRRYLSQWVARLNITDGETGTVFARETCFEHEPLEAEILARASSIVQLLQDEKDYEANAMNLPTDEQRAIEHLRKIKVAVILEIRANPDVTQVQAQAYIDANYSDSIVNFDRLYQFYLSILNLSTWAEFKSWVIGHKFRDID